MVTITEAQRRREREMVRKEVEKLQKGIQTLCQSTNPLGKIMDYVQVSNGCAVQIMIGGLWNHKLKTPTLMWRLQIVYRIYMYLTPWGLFLAEKIFPKNIFLTSQSGLIGAQQNIPLSVKWNSLLTYFIPDVY